MNSLDKLIMMSVNDIKLEAAISLAAVGILLLVSALIVVLFTVFTQYAIIASVAGFFGACIWGIYTVTKTYMEISKND